MTFLKSKLSLVQRKPNNDSEIHHCRDNSQSWHFMIVTLHDRDASWFWRFMIVTLHDCDALKIDFKRTWWLCWHIYYLDELTCYNLGGCPGLVVMGDNSWSRGRGFESRHCILDGIDIFSHWCLFAKTENKRKRGRSWPIFKNVYQLCLFRKPRSSSFQSWPTIMVPLKGIHNKYRRTIHDNCIKGSAYLRQGQKRVELSLPL